ncbi:unnamed protein product [Orchesella dallaii]|uniref:Uncharacterized protein n=1 Tax=Orchesella dallaii TaxID=48710 RepID=A0ABP1QF96_9HEXA
MDPNNQKLIDLVREVEALEEEEFQTVLVTLAKRNVHPNVAKYITNKWQQSKEAEKGLPSKSRNETIKLFGTPETPQPREGRLGRSSRACESSPSASLVPDAHGVSAWKVPFLLRGALVPIRGTLAIDVEKLSMKKGWNGEIPTKKKGSHCQVENNIAIVNEKGLLVFWAFISRDLNDVCQLFTPIHRIDQAKLLTGVGIETIRELLSKVLEGNLLIGANLAEDLKSLSLQNEIKKNYFSHPNMIELQDFLSIRS